MREKKSAIRERYHEVLKDFREWCAERGLSFPQEMALLMRMRMGRDVEASAVEMSSHHEERPSPGAIDRPVRKRSPEAIEKFKATMRAKRAAETAAA